MIRTILVGLDGSESSQAAVALGKRWAKKYGARVVGLGVVDEPAIRKPQPVPLGASHYAHEAEEAAVRDARRKIESILERFTNECIQDGISYQILEDVGKPCERISLEAQRYDLIVLGQETHFHFASGNRGCDTLEDVLRAAPRPVVCVPKKIKADGPVLVGYDASLQAARALQEYVALMGRPDEPIHVLSAAKNSKEASSRVSYAVEYLRNRGIDPVIHAVASKEPPGQVLLDAAKKIKAGLIVMGAYGQPRFRELVLGSVTKTLVKKSPVPLFLYH